ncbi:DUF4236 domain-containing protein [Actinoplanes utahensis]|nr:DUF4236 domain-containing protein [Actinoplanes utahensis]
MGFYLRTDLKAGPFRFTLTGSGVGVSVGVPGFRIGTGPRGNYIRVGALGTSYFNAPVSPVAVPAPVPVGGPHQAVDMRDMTGVAVQHLAAAHPSDLVTQIQAAAKQRSLWHWAAVALLVLIAVLPPAGLLLLVPGVPGIWWLWQRDLARRSVVVFYQVEDEAAARYEHLTGNAGFVTAVQAVWEVEAQGSLTTPYQQKVNAGASALVGRHPATIDLAGPPCLVTNIAVPSLHGRDRSIYFLPDRALVRHGEQYADIPYFQLGAYFEEQRFVESGTVPGDAQTVGTTWQYANKSGGPDRRYKDNRQLPIMRYGRLTLTSPGGLLMIWDFSRPDVPYALASVLSGMGRTVG